MLLAHVGLLNRRVMVVSCAAFRDGEVMRWLQDFVVMGLAGVAEHFVRGKFGDHYLEDDLRVRGLWRIPERST